MIIKKKSGFFTSVNKDVKNAIGITTSSINIKKTIIDCVYKAKKNINQLISKITDVSIKNNLKNRYKINNNDLLFDYDFSDDNLSSLINKINNVSEQDIIEKLKILIKILDLSKAIRNYYPIDDEVLNKKNKEEEEEGEEGEEEEEGEEGEEEG